MTVLAKDFSKPIKNQLSEQMDHLNETIFMNRSVAEILWGYEDGFIGLVDKYFHIPVWDTDQFGILWGVCLYFSFSHIEAINKTVNEKIH